MGKVWREAIEPAAGNRVERALLRENHARILYNTEGLEMRDRMGE